MTEPGWFDDPTGRFGKRWHDGSTWTSHVVDRSGNQAQDQLSAPPPPQGQAQGGPAYGSQQYGSQPYGGQYSGQAYGSQPYGGQQYSQGQPAQQGYPSQGYQGGYGTEPRTRYLPGIGLGFGGLGVIALLLSLFVLDWSKGSKGGFLDLAKTLRKQSTSHLDAAPSITVIFGSWAAFVLFGLAVVLALLAGIPVPASAAGNTYARIVGALIAGLGAVGQMITMTQVFKGPPSPQFGAWLGIAGWVLLLIGFALGARRTTR